MCAAPLICGVFTIKLYEFVDFRYISDIYDMQPFPLQGRFERGDLLCAIITIL